MGEERRIPAVVKDGSVVVSEAGVGELHGRFGMGEMRGGELHLAPVEALYLMETGRIRMAGIRGLDRLLAMFSDEVVRYLVYRDLRRRGCSVRTFTAPYDLRIYRAGDPSREGASRSWARCVSESEMFTVEDICSWLGPARRAGRRLVLAVVDEDGDITYYQAQEIDLHGSLPPLVPGRRRVACLVMEERAMIFDEGTASTLHSVHFFGRLMRGALHLSLVEALYLEGKGVVTLKGPSGKRVSRKVVMARMCGRDGNAPLKLQAYTMLRERHLIPRTGFKYGAYFRAYAHHPEEEHAPYLIHAVRPGYTTTWSSVSMAVRLAHGVRKEMIFCEVPEKGDLRFLRMVRVKI